MTNKTHPNVSVILPTYNRAHLIKRSIDSILDQTYADFEIIIVDDGSTDNTKEIIEQYTDERIRYIGHEINKGAPSAMNTGIKNSKGDFLSFQGSDDKWLPEKLQKEMLIFKESSSDVGVVYSGIWSIEKNERKYKPDSSIQKKEGIIHDELLKGNFVNGLSSVKKECFEKCGLFDENLFGLEDWELYIRISKNYEFRIVDEPLMIAYNAEGNISSNYLKLFNAKKIIIDKHFKEFSKDKKVLAINYGILGSLLFLSEEKKKARSYFIDAIKLDFNLKYIFAYLLSYFGKKMYTQVLGYYQKN